MDTYYPVASFGDLSDMMHSYVRERALKLLASDEAEKAAITTPDQALERVARLRAGFLAGIGGLPERDAELAPAWGELRERGEYSVQNVIFTAAKDVYVTATVWRPLGWSGERPGVLFPCGHHEFPREVAEYQEVCAWFAVNGYVTLAFDPPGQGEQKLCWDLTLQRSFAGSGSAEHEHLGVKCELLGQNICRYFIQHGMAAFDLLASLPEVDGARIAVTGNSGGGTQSCLLMVADERIAAAIPCTFTTSREAYMRFPHWHDEEQNITGAMAFGLDYDDFYAVFAPKPAAIGAVTWDFFPIEGTRASFERLQRLYSAYGAEDCIALFEVECQHEYHPVMRQRAIEWLNRFLQPEASFRPPSSFEPEPVERQRNTPTGQVATSIAGARLVFEQTVAGAEALRPRRCGVRTDGLRTRLGLPEDDHPLNPRVLLQVTEGDVTVEKLFLVPEGRIVMPVLRLAPSEPRGAVVCCTDGGVASISGEDEAVLRAAVGQGMSVYIVEPRGTGETRSRAIGAWGEPTLEGNRLAETWLAHHLRMMGTSLGALRGYDIARALEYIRLREQAAPVTLMAEGLVGWSALIAAVLDGRVKALCLRGLRPSIEEFVTDRTAFCPQAYAIPGILAVGDAPELAAATGASRLLVIEPLDAHGRAICEAEWQARYDAEWAIAATEVCVLPKPDSLERTAALVSFLAK